MQHSFKLIIIAVLIISTVIDEVVIMTILFGVVEKGNHSLSIALLLFVQLVPSVLLAPYGGYIVDKHGARKVVLITGLAEIPVLLALSFASSVAQIYFLSAVMSALFAFSGPAIFALIPSAAKRAGISVERANSMIEVVGGLGAIAGPVLGGLSVQSLKIDSVIQITAAWSLFLIVVMYFSALDSPRSGEKDPVGSFISQFRTSYRPILRLSQIRYLYITFFAIVFSTTLSDVIFVFFVIRDLQGGPIEVGVLISLWSAGLTMGAWYLGGERDSRSIVRFAYFGAIGMGASLLLTGLTSGTMDPWRATVAVGVLFIIGGIANGIHNVAVRDAIFRYVPQGQHGRAFSLYSLITRIAAVLGYFSGGLAGEQNAKLVYIVSGLLALTFGAAGLTTVVRFVDQQRAGRSGRLER